MRSSRASSRRRPSCRRWAARSSGSPVTGGDVRSPTSCATSILGTGTFLTAVEPSAKMTEPPLQEGIHRPQVPAPAVCPTDPGRFLWGCFEFLHELLDVQDRARQLIDDRDCRSLG